MFGNIYYMGEEVGLQEKIVEIGICQMWQKWGEGSINVVKSFYQFDEEVFTMKKKLGALLMVFCMCLISLVSPLAVKADEAQVEGDVLTLEIEGKTYEVTNGGSVIGDFNLKNLEVTVTAVNGNKLENVGTNSGVLDSQGRTVLEVQKVEESDTCLIWNLVYHAEDDPVAANQQYGFNVAGIKFANSDAATNTAPTIAKVKSVKATAKSKALKLTWKKASDISGYQIQYSTSKKFTNAKTIKASKSKTSYTIKKLKGNKKYYVRIRAYKTYTDELGENVQAYGKWVTVNKTTKK